MPLPQFRYHPDPEASGVVEASDASCTACGRARGFIYSGPVYGQDDLNDSLCPWCIADQTAAERFDVEFTAVGSDIPADVPRSVIEELTQRTPGFYAWQEPRWLYHCADAAAFVGYAGTVELEQHPEALAMVRQEYTELGMAPDDVAEYVASLDKDGEPTAYLFRCLHCGTHLAYSDFS
jgi:hypothetical protein